MYAWAQGKSFAEAEVPADSAERREKLTARREKQKENASKPRKVNKTALAKKDQSPAQGTRSVRDADE